MLGGGLLSDGEDEKVGALSPPKDQRDSEESVGAYEHLHQMYHAAKALDEM